MDKFEQVRACTEVLKDCKFSQDRDSYACEQYKNTCAPFANLNRLIPKIRNNTAADHKA